MNWDGDLVNQSQIERLSILNKLLSNAFGKEKDSSITFHDIINREQECVNDYLQNPLFSDFMKYRHSERKKNNIKRFKKNYSVILRKQIDFIKKDNNKINENEKDELTKEELEKKMVLKKIMREQSLPNIFITRKSVPLKKTSISNYIEIIEKEKEDIKKLENNNDNNNNDNKDEPWFIDLSDNNPIKRLLFDKKNKTERNDYMKIIKRMKKTNFINGEKKPSSFLQIIKNQIDKFQEQSNLRKWGKDQNYRISKFNQLIKKCSLEINRGKKLVKCIDENNEKLNEKYEEIQNLKNKLNENPIPKITDYDNKTFNKYKMLEEKNFQQIKKKINLKISDDYVFQNKKLYNEFMKQIDIEAYEIYLKELNEINKEKKKNKDIEKMKMEKIENILTKTFKQKEFLKSKIAEKKKHYNLLKKEENLGPYYPLPGEINPPINPIMEEMLKKKEKEKGKKKN